MFLCSTLRNAMKTLAAVVTALALASPASAGVVLTGHPVFGADSIIRDTSNDRDFLRLDFTDALTYDETVAELGPGGQFEGCHVASRQEIEDLGASAGIVDMSTDPTVLAAAEELRDWFGNVQISASHEYCRGLISDPYDASHQLAFTIGRRFSVTPEAVDFRLSGYGARIDPLENVYLVVPEPATLSLLALGSLVALRRRRR